MRESGRVQAAIDLLDAIIEAARSDGPPADRLITEYFKTRRYAGSKDRRAVRDLVYRAIRACGPIPSSGRAAMLALAREDDTIAAHFDGSPYGPAPIAPEETAALSGVAPEWLEARLQASDIAGPEAQALLGRAALDIRINRVLIDSGIPELPESGDALTGVDGLRFPHGTPVESWDAYRDGMIEVQDYGSQLACAAVGAKSGQNVIDLCAGAGGKTLGLASAMGGQGRILASDTDARRLGNLMPRAHRAGVAGMIETLLLDPKREFESLAPFAGQADHVVVDAPCSSAGTWRRNPEARWRLTPDRLKSLCATQHYLIDLATRLVKPGGKLTYITCSVLDEEGAGQIASALARHPGWIAQELDLPAGTRRGHGVRLTPHVDQCDGFFIAQLTAP